MKRVPHNMVGGGPPSMIPPNVQNSNITNENKRKLDAAYASGSMMTPNTMGMTVDHVCQFLSLRKDPNFPSAVIRNTEPDITRVPYSNIMVSTMMACMNHISAIIYPANPKQLCTESSRALLTQAGIMPHHSMPYGSKTTQSQKALHMASSMCQEIKKLPKNSPKSEALLSHLCQHFSQNEVYDLFHLAPNEIEENEFAASNSDLTNISHVSTSSVMQPFSNKKFIPLDSDDPKKKKGKKSSLPQPVLYHLTALFRSDVKITTKAMLPRLKLMCEQNRTPWLQGYTETQLHTKFNSMKHKYKKTNQLPELPRMN